MAEKLIKKLNNREFYAKYSDYAAMDEDGERLSDRKVKSVSLDAASGTMTVTNTDGTQEIPVVPVPDQEGKVLKSNADGTYAWGAAGAEPGSGKLYVKFGSAQEVDTNFNANSDSKVTLVIPLASAVEGNEEDGLMSSEDKGVLDGLPDKIGGLDDRIITIEHDYVTSQGLQTALSPIQGDVDSLGGQVGSLDQGKADKVSPATSGNLASLDAGGDLADSGISGTAVGGALDKLGGIESGAQENKIETISVDGTEITPANKTVNIDLSGKVDVVAGKQLSTEDYTTAEKDKLGHVAAGAQVNVIETVQLNGTEVTPSGKTVNIQLDKSSVGLGNVNNTSDSDKPISTATQSALDGKANKLVPASANNLAALDTNGQLTEVGLTLVNNSITAIGGKTITGTESVFVAIYNSTRGDAITAALNSGKVVISVYYDGSIGFVTYQDKNNHKYGFTCVRKISNQLGQTPGTIQFGGWFCNGAGNSWYGQHSSLVLPAPGSNDIGKVLTAYKDNTNNGNYRLETINGVPSSTSSDEGKLLTVNSEGTPSWEEPIKELPPIVAGDEDKFLRVSSSGVPAWDNPFEKSSWGTVITDGDNGLADENGNLIFDENETELWTSFNNVGFGAERAIADVEGNDIIATYAKKSEVPAGLPSTTGASNGDVLTVNNGAATWSAPSGGGGGDDAVYVVLGDLETGIPVGQTEKWDEIAEYLVDGKSVMGRVTQSGFSFDAPATTQIDLAYMMRAMGVSTLAELKELCEAHEMLDMLTIKFAYEVDGSTLRIDVTPDAGVYPRYFLSDNFIEISEVGLNMDVSLRPTNVYRFKITNNKYMPDYYSYLDNDIEELLRDIVSTCSNCKFTGWMGNTPGESTPSKFYGKNIPAQIKLVDGTESENTTIQIDVNGLVLKYDPNVSYSDLNTLVPAMWRGEFEFTKKHDYNRYWQTKDTAFELATVNA